MNDKLERFKSIYNATYQDYIKSADFTSKLQTFAKVILELKQDLSNQITSTKSEANSSIKKVSDSLFELELNVTRLVNGSEKGSLVKIQELSQKVSNEINRLERSIPKLPDFTFLENRIDEVTKEVENFPKLDLDKPTEVRDKLETLKGEDRLDISAIKGLGKRLSKLSDEIVNRAIGILDSRTSFLINKVSNLQNQVNNLPAPGVGSGHTIQDEGVNQTTRTNLNFVGAGVTVTDDAGNNATKVTIPGGGSTTVETPVGSVNGVNAVFTVSAQPLWVVSDGITIFDGAGYTYSALSITLDSPPTLYIRSIS